LDGTANFQLLRMLARTGHRDEIPDLIRRFINRTDDPFTKADFLAGSTIETGDLSTLYLATRESLRLRPNHEQARRSMMWFYIFVGDRSRALSYVSGADSVTAMILRDDLPALVRKVAALGTDFWSLNWETYDASDYLVRHGRSDLVADLFMRTRAATGGKDPQPTAIDSSVVLALRRAGKPQLAEELLGELERDLDRSGTPAAVAAQGRADLLLLRGEQEKALDLLETAQRAHWWNVQPSILPLEDRVVYDSVRDHPRFRAIVRTWYSNVNREKLELASELRRGGNGRFVAERLISPRS